MEMLTRAAMQAECRSRGVTFNTKGGDSYRHDAMQISDTAGTDDPVSGAGKPLPFAVHAGFADFRKRQETNQETNNEVLFAGAG
jgi:hypothetical protein